MSTSLFLKAMKSIDDSEPIAVQTAQSYGYLLHEVALKRWFILRVANALLNN